MCAEGELAERQERGIEQRSCALLWNNYEPDADFVGAAALNLPISDALAALSAGPALVLDESLFSSFTLTHCLFHVGEWDDI